MHCIHSIPFELWEDRYEERNQWGVITEISVYHKLTINGYLPGSYIPNFSKNEFRLYLYNENLAGGTKLIVEESATFSWVGKWESNHPYWGTFIFNQNENLITGSCNVGSFSGTVSGNILTGTCDGDELRLTMSPDGDKFNMEYKSGGSWLKMVEVAVRVS